MSADAAQRRLAAILAGDVAGYSRLMGDDELATVVALRSLRKEVIDPKLAEHRGRLVNTAGDSVLVEFSSVVDAVRCAVEIQQAIAVRNADVPESRRIVLRIGLNVGDVIFQEGEIYGDGVNVAARLEQIAQPGTVYASRAVHEQVGERLPYVFESLGVREVKNIAQPVDVWRVRWDGSAGTPRRSARDARPSLAVLPFVNASADAEQEYFVDGLTEDLITDIARFSRMQVVSRDAVFAYKGRSVDAATVGRELGAHHVLQGSVRRSRDRIRLNVQLTDTATNGLVWAKRFDNELADLFDVQDQMTRAIVSELEVQILEGEQAVAWQRGTTNPLALDYFRRSRAAQVVITLAGFLEAKRHLEKAVELDPRFARARASLAAQAMGAIMFGLPADHDRMLETARREAQEAIALDPNLAEGWIARGQAHVFDREVREADEAARKGLVLGPKANIVISGAARIYLFTGRVEAALDLARSVPLKRSVSRHPGIIVGLGSIVLGRYEDALPMAEAQLGPMPDSPVTRLILAAAYAGLGRTDDAREQRQHLDRLLLGESFESLAGWMLPFVDPAPREQIVALLARRTRT
jgi:adenylate cyclase